MYTIFILCREITQKKCKTFVRTNRQSYNNLLSRHKFRTCIRKKHTRMYNGTEALRVKVE